MKDILKDLWYGRICPYEDYATSPEIRRLEDISSNAESELRAKLSEDEIELLDKLLECQMEALCEIYSTIFARAYRLGEKLTLAIFDEE